MPRNPLHSAHTDMGAFLVERAGTAIPSRFGDPATEHLAVRAAVGIFDLTSAGKIRVHGSERLRFLNALLAADLRPLRPGQGCYSLLFSRDGHIASELRVAIADDHVLILTPPITRGKVLKSLERHVATSDVVIEDVTESHVLLSVCGPLANYVLATVLGSLVPEISPFGIADVPTKHGRIYLVRSPRTGEDGLDVLVPADGAEILYRRLVAEARTCGGLPCGLEALESLRVEMGRPAFGSEIDETTLPSEIPEAADQARGMCLAKGCFLGREAAARDAEHGTPTKRLAGLVFGSQVPPVRGDKLLIGGQLVGKVTTGAFSPSIGRGIALAMVDPVAMKPGTDVASADGDHARVVALPFPRTADR